MRNLEADLAEFNHWMCDNYDTYDPTLMWFSGVLPEAITRAIKAEGEVERLQEVASIAWNVVETKGLSDVLLHELAGRLADWETWKEGEI